MGLTASKFIRSLLTITSSGTQLWTPEPMGIASSFSINNFITQEKTTFKSAQATGISASNKYLVETSSANIVGTVAWPYALKIKVLLSMQWVLPYALGNSIKLLVR